MDRSRRRVLVAGAVLATVMAGSASETKGYGRRFWYPLVVTVWGAKTHAQVLADLRLSHRAKLTGIATAAGVPYPPNRLRLVAIKDEKRLEVWGAQGETWKHVTSYPVLAASGGPGPKLREGDRQVPEGIYRLTAFNPNSSYHLSLRVDYPSAEDRAIARREGRENPGSDIFIHGKAVSIGCLAIGDAAIEELYLLVAETGLDQADILIAPTRQPRAPQGSPSWLIDRYARLERELERLSPSPRP